MTFQREMRLAKGLETGRFHTQAVAARLEKRDRVVPFGVCVRRGSDIRGDIRHGYLGDHYELEHDLALLDDWRAPSRTELEAIRGHGDRAPRWCFW